MIVEIQGKYDGDAVIIDLEKVSLRKIKEIGSFPKDFVASYENSYISISEDEFNRIRSEMIKLDKIKNTARWVVPSPREI